MPWLKLFYLALQVAMWFLSWAEKQKAIAEGEANAVKVLLEKSNELIHSAQRARDSVSSDPAGDVLDEFNRDAPAGEPADKKDSV